MSRFPARLDPPLLLSGLLCAWLLAWTIAGIALPPMAGIPLAFIALSFAPGHAVSRALRIPRPPAAFEWPVDAVIGLSLSLLAATLAVRLDLSIDLVPVAVGGAGLIASAVALALPARSGPAAGAWRRWLPNLPLLALAAVTVTLVSVKATQAGDELPLYADTWAYLRFVRQFQEDDLRVHDPYARGDDVEARMQFPGWLALQASLARLGGVPALDLYTRFLPAALAVVALGALLAQARELVHSRDLPAVGVNVGLGAVVLAGLLFGSAINADGAGFLFLTRLGEDKLFLWFVLMPVAFTLSLRFFDHDEQHPRWRPGLYAVTAVTVAAVAMTHPLGLFQYAVYFGGFAAVEALVCRRRGLFARGALLAAIVLACVAVPLSQRGAISGERIDIDARLAASSPLDARRVWILSAEDRLFMASPRLLLNPLTIAGLVALVPLAFRARRSRAARFVIVASALPALLVLTPVTAPLTARIISVGLLWRVLWLIPTALALAVLAHEYGPAVLQRVPRVKRGRTAAACLAPAAALAVLALALVPRMREQVAQVTPLKQQLVTAEERALMDALPDVIEPGSGVMTPPTFQGYCGEFALPAEAADELPAGTTRCPLDLAYRLSAVIPGMYGLSYRTRILDEGSFAALARFYNGPVLNRGKLETIRRYGIRYVIFFDPSPALPIALEAPDIFIPGYEDDTYRVFRIDAEALDAEIERLTR